MPKASDAKETQVGERTSLQSKTYHLTVEGTRPVLQIELSSGKAGNASDSEKLTIELHTPVSGEVFEARTSSGRLEVDRDGRVMYFCQAPESASFTLFLGRSVTVSMSRKTGVVTLKSPSKMLSVEREAKADTERLGNAPPTDSLRIVLE